jgi:DNA-binding transcriptional LysR family regulator
VRLGGLGLAHAEHRAVALTRSLLELEDEPGSPLFERNSRGMKRTPQGHRFLSNAHKPLGSVADALRRTPATPQR